MSRATACAVAVVVVLTSVLQERPAGVVASPVAKKVCHTVSKKVHGKKKKVKVCTSVKPKPTATPTPQAPDQAATQLAATVLAATSDSARHAALLSVFKAIHIGVYDETTGTAMVSGMEVSDKDFYLYDGELGGLVSALGNGQTYTFDALASVFSDVGIQPNGKPVDPIFLSGFMQGYVRWAQRNSSQPMALLPLLVEDLGLKRSPAVDLATTDHPEQYQLDAVQMQLLAIAFLAPLVHEGAANSQKAALHVMLGACTPIKVALNPLNPNTYLPDDHQLFILTDQLGSAYGGQQLDAFLKTFSSEAAEIAGKVANWASLVGAVANMLHGMLLAAGLQVVSGPVTQQSTHYGPTGHDTDAGKPLQFQAKANMFFKLPNALRSCLHDAGIDVPAQGPVPNVPIDWDNGSYLSLGQNHLDDYGTVTVNPADSKTGPDGVSTMTFTPKNEGIPGVGSVVKVVGHERPRAMWGIAFSNPLGAVDEVLFPITGATMDWTVGLHQAKGYTFSFSVKEHEVFAPVTGGGGRGGSHPPPTDADLSDSMTVSICGNNPYGDPNRSTSANAWSMSGSRTETLHYPDGYVFSSTNDLGASPLYLLQDNSFGQAYATSGDINQGLYRFTAHLVPGPSPQVAIHWTAAPISGSTISPPSGDITVPVTEDASCPTM